VMLACEGGVARWDTCAARKEDSAALTRATARVRVDGVDGLAPCFALPRGWYAAITPSRSRHHGPLRHSDHAHTAAPATPAGRRGPSRHHAITPPWDHVIAPPRRRAITCCHAR
jgi:hypothetical protein